MRVYSPKTGKLRMRTADFSALGEPIELVGRSTKQFFAHIDRLWTDGLGESSQHFFP